MLPTAHGHLKQLSMPRLLWGLKHEEKTGVLFVERRLVQKRFFLKDGHIVGAESNLLQDRLDDYLVKNEKISETQVHDIREKYEKTGTDLKTLLLDGKIFNSTELFKMLKQNLIQTVIDCFLWDDGKYRFEETNDIPNSGLRADVFHVLVKGIQTSIPFERMREDISLILNKPTRVIAAILPTWTEGYLNPMSLKIIRGFQVPKKPRFVMQELSIEEETMLRIVYLFDVTGLILNTEQELGEDVPPPPPGEVKSIDPGQSEALIQQICDLNMKLGDLNHFELLGLNFDATVTKVKVVWLEFISQYSLKNFAAGPLAEYRLQVENILLRAAEAYSVLTDFDRKEKYIDKIKAEKKGPTNKPKPGAAFAIKTNLLDAPSQFKKGVQFLNQRSFAKAIEFFEYARDIDGRNSVYTAYLAWAKFKKDPDDLMETHQLFEEANKAGSEEPKIQMLFGRYLCQTGESKKGLSLLARAASTSPKDMEIKQALGAERSRMNEP